MFRLQDQVYVSSVGRLTFCAATLIFVRIGLSQSPPQFNTLATTIATFTPSPSTLPGLPTTTLATIPPLTVPTVGYQGGDLVNGKVLYYPWEVISGDIAEGIPQGVILSYNGAVTGFNTASGGNWSVFNMTTLLNLPPYTVAGFNGAVIVGNMVYLIPASISASYPVFVQYDASRALTVPNAYQVFAAPANGGILGWAYGWCGGVYDGKYLYYTPSVSNGNIVRYDPSTPFNPNTPGSSWSSFNMATSLTSAAAGFQSAVYDGHRFIYFIPTANKLLVRFDTQYGTPGTPNPSAFTTAAAYKTFDPTQIGSSGYPPFTGEGNVQNLQGFTGAAVAWDSTDANEYLYFVPWATFPDGTQGGLGTAVLESTAARMRVGTQTGSTWSYVDVTGTDIPHTAAPNWQIFDLQNLLTNPQWATNVSTLGWPAYPALYPTGPYAGQSMMAGFQLAWIDTVGTEQRVAFGAAVSQFWVEHDVSRDLTDAAGWYVAQVPSTHRNGSFGGAWDPVHRIIYPSSPSVPLMQVGFSAPKTSPATALFRIDCGSSTTFTDFFDHLWSADEYLQGGSHVTTTNQINNTMTPLVYQTAVNGEPKYTLPVSNGVYNVILKFADIQYSKPGLRQFNVLINGAQVLTNFDIVQAAGAGFTAIDKSFPVNVTGSSITIQFTQGAIAYPLINGIEVDLP